MLGALSIPILMALASESSAIRLLNVLSSEASDLSGRDVIWPYFEDAWDASPWVGWGVGAGKVVVDPESLTAKLLGTTAAHDEYLRIGVDGGYVGLGLLIVLMALWVIFWTRHAIRTDKWIIRMVFLAFALHSITDNTLIAATASVLFAWVSAVFARSELEWRDTSVDSVMPRPRRAQVDRQTAPSY
jgi:O-antigen ligase